MKRFICPDKRVQSICDKVDVLMETEGLRGLLLGRTFDYTELTGDVVFGLISDNVVPCSIQLYNGRIWSKVYGYYSTGKTIFLNSRKLNRSDASIAGTVAHEYIHLLDNFLPNYSFGHGDNSPKNKSNTVPYYIGETIEHLYKQGDTL